jgi:hypothetical protein
MTRKIMHKLKAILLVATFLFCFLVPAVAQRGRNQHDQKQNYYGGMHNSVKRGDYDRYSREDDRRHNYNSGGIGPGKAALIGGAGGAVLGAVFGGGLKGTLIGGAAGAGIGAIGGKLAQGNDHDKNRNQRR